MQEISVRRAKSIKRSTRQRNRHARQVADSRAALLVRAGRDRGTGDPHHAAAGVDDAQPRAPTRRQVNAGQAAVLGREEVLLVAVDRRVEDVAVGADPSAIDRRSVTHINPQVGASGSGHDVGSVGMRVGPIMASYDIFDITVTDVAQERTRA